MEMVIKNANHDELQKLFRDHRSPFNDDGTVRADLETTDIPGVELTKAEPGVRDVIARLDVLGEVLIEIHDLLKTINTNLTHISLRPL